MMENELNHQIREFTPENGNWLPLEKLFEIAYESPDCSGYYDAIFNLFERFPDDDGSGVFWSAVHGMEEKGNYEEKLLAYFRRFPTRMTRIMLVRLKNSGVEEISTVKIDSLF
jgi:hypothetical protein